MNKRKLCVEYIKKELGCMIPKVEVYDCVDSTNTMMKEIAKKGGEDLSVIIASEQTAGRGRMGRTFHSPEGTGLYMSILVEIKKDENPLLITTDAAVAISRVFDKMTGKRALIKWVNDIYMDNKKVCGILTEGIIGEKCYGVLGIGVNITEPEKGFPEDIKTRAGSVFSQYEPYLREKTAAEILKEFIKVHRNTEKNICLKEYRERSMIIGKEIEIIKNGIYENAVALEIADDYSLTVKKENGEICSINSGDVSIKMV